MAACKLSRDKNSTEQFVELETRLPSAEHVRGERKENSLLVPHHGHGPSVTVGNHRESSFAYSG